MEEENSVIYGLDYQARSLASQHSESESARFLVGTQSLKFDNQLYVLDFEEDSSHISKQTFSHPAGEIWQIAARPGVDDLFATCFAGTKEARCRPGCALWLLPSTSAADAFAVSPLELVAKVDTSAFASASSFQWQPVAPSTSAFLLCDNSIVLFDVNGAAIKETSRLPVEVKTASKAIVGKWNPHHKCQSVAVAHDGFVKGFDVRSNEQTFVIENAHSPIVRDLDFNHNRQYILATAGDDCKTKIWDTRFVDKPLGVVGRHSHWIWNVRYNPVHDQLLLTCSSDARCVLHCVQSLSSDAAMPARQSASFDENDEDRLDEADRFERSNENREQLCDGVIKTYEEHEESVYCVEWSVNDPWIFASLSYDGRIIFSKIPRSIKYKILEL